MTTGEAQKGSASSSISKKRKEQSVQPTLPCFK